MSTIYLLFAVGFSSNGNVTYQAEFNSQGACVMAIGEGERAHLFDNAICVPKG
mgnify:CR=1 FL=1